MSIFQGLSPQGNSNHTVPMEAPFAFLGNPQTSKAGTYVFIQAANGPTLDIFNADRETAISWAEQVMDALNWSADNRLRLQNVRSLRNSLSITEVANG